MESQVHGDPPVSFRVGPYALYMRIEDLRGIEELSAAEYALLPKNFQDEQIFSAADCDFVGCDWQVTIGARAGYVYKIFLENKFKIPEQGDAAFSQTRMHWERTLGPPSEESPPRTTWDAPFGNVILVKRQIAGVSYVNLCLTSRDVNPRSDTDASTVEGLADKVRAADSRQTVNAAFANFVVRPFSVVMAIWGILLLLRSDWVLGPALILACFSLSLTGRSLSKEESSFSDAAPKMMLAFWLVFGIASMRGPWRWYYAIPISWFASFLVVQLPHTAISLFMGLRHSRKLRSP